MKTANAFSFDCLNKYLAHLGTFQLNVNRYNQLRIRQQRCTTVYLHAVAARNEDAWNLTLLPLEAELNKICK